jgi:3-oxoadipate enol-lactonase
LHIIEKGRGRAVVLLHGTPSTTKCFAPLVDALAESHRVLIPDLPGYGATPAMDGPYSLERAQRDLEDALLARGVERAVIGGYSGGAYRAFAMACASRVRVDAVVSIAGFAGLDAEMRDGMRGGAAVLRSAGAAAFRPVWLQRMAGPGFAERFPAETNDVMAWLDCAAPETLAGELDAIAGAEDLRPQLSTLGVPVLAMVGSVDAAVPRACSEDIARRAADVELHVVGGCGHALAYEARERVTSAVAGFVKRIATSERRHFC